MESSFTLSGSFKGGSSKTKPAATTSPTYIATTSSSNLSTIRTGSADLDAVLGGGFVLGSLVLVIEDHPTHYWENLV